jgi:hypothetical protein
MIQNHRTGNLSAVSCVHCLPAQGIKTAEIENCMSMLQAVSGNAIDAVKVESSLSSGQTVRQVYPIRRPREHQNLFMFCNQIRP